MVINQQNHDKNTQDEKGCVVYMYNTFIFLYPPILFYMFLQNFHVHRITVRASLMGRKTRSRRTYQDNGVLALVHFYDFYCLYYWCLRAGRRCGCCFANTGLQSGGSGSSDAFICNNSKHTLSEKKWQPFPHVPHFRLYILAINIFSWASFAVDLAAA